MNIKDFYGFIEEDYGEVSSRLITEARVLKYVLKFPADENYELLKNSVGGKDYETAFRAAHTLKGICLNLGFGKLHDTASDITEMLRNFGETERISSDPKFPELMALAEEQYGKIISGIGQIEQ